MLEIRALENRCFFVRLSAPYAKAFCHRNERARSHARRAPTARGHNFTHVFLERISGCEVGPRALPATARPHPGRTLYRAYGVRYMLLVGDAPDMRRGRVGGAHGGPKFSHARPSAALDYVCHHESGCMHRSGGIGRGIRVPTFLGPEIERGGREPPKVWEIEFVGAFGTGRTVWVLGLSTFSVPRFFCSSGPTAAWTVDITDASGW